MIADIVCSKGPQSISSELWQNISRLGHDKSITFQRLPISRKYKTTFAVNFEMITQFVEIAPSPRNNAEKMRPDGVDLSTIGFGRPKRGAFRDSRPIPRGIFNFITQPPGNPERSRYFAVFSNHMRHRLCRRCRRHRHCGCPTISIKPPAAVVWSSRSDALSVDCC